MIKRIISFFNYFYLDAFKIIFYSIITKFVKRKDTNKIIKIKAKKLKGENIYIRPFTTDMLLLKLLFLKNGQYDFLYNDFKDIAQNAKVIVDVGANIGLFSRLMRVINTDAKIIAIEPEDNNYNLLEKNALENLYVCDKHALWNTNSSLEVVPSVSGEWGFTVRESYNKKDAKGITIEELLKKYDVNYIDILKIDIEGAEFEVFDNSSDSWIDKVGILIIEMHDRKKKGCTKRVINKMKKHNFVYKIYNENYVFTKQHKK